MNAQPKQRWVLSKQVTETVQRLMDEGRVRDLDEVVQIALGVLLDEHDPEDTAWLRAEVLPVIEAFERDPSRVIPAAKVFDEIRALHAKRLDEG